MAQREIPEGLKHLGCVQDCGKILERVINKSTNTIAPIYETGVNLLPDFTKPYITTAEERIRQLGAPVIVNAQDKAEKILKKADDQVDKVVSNAHNIYQAGRSTVDTAVNNIMEIHQNNIETYQQTTHKYFQLVSSTAEWVAARVAPTQAFQKAHEILRLSLNKAQECADPDKAVKIVYDSWVVFSSVPVVASVLPYLEPAAARAFQNFRSIHDSLVVSPHYKQGYDMASATLQWATTTSPFRLGANVMRPFMQPVADVFQKKIVESQVASQLFNYWKPVTA
uniref:Uncharacterized protein n=1 Tax=Polytomella parva TaxID=51329 RepID=A0A7S0V118_9CHLO|mmetsp:Transcript_21293/g.38055  ORF Transcript_21293/g.38055 Transcript_21293/m.38055 type:complete len:282 (+) Transcript_21293:129-974(+)